MLKAIANICSKINLMPSISTYLSFDDSCEAAFNFYKSVFGGEFISFQRFGDMPSETPLAPEDAAKVMHVALPIGNGSVLMGSDIGPGYPKVIMGTQFSLSVNTESEEDADRLFKGLSAEGVVTMPLQKTFWNAYFGMFTDRFGFQWMVNYDYPQV